ncbi:MAG: hypothetical protein LC650_05705 [Actinobacteria bacterium]|nr:hypothetical protein [Actinomycetota bacterium]
MKITVDTLRSVYKPRTGTAVTGWIPMHVFDTLEDNIREDMKGKCLRVIYRGPRPDLLQSMTRRADATHAVIYHR